MLAIYRRFKDSGEWKAEKIKEGRGIRTSDIAGPFFIRPTINGVQERRTLHSVTFAEARAEANEVEKQCEAQSKGLTVGELSAMENSHRIPIKLVVDTYLQQKANKRPNTIAQYTTALREFLGSTRVKYLDEINADVLRNYMNYLTSKGYAGSTIDNRLNVLYFMLKKNGVTARIPRDEMPTVETEAAVPYSDSELKAMFKIMTPEDNIVYSFFLGTAARQQETEFAAWADINFERGIFTVRSKPDVGFVVKNHESRQIFMPDSLTKALKARRDKMPESRWIFPNTKGEPRNHYLRKLKLIALRAGINCGHCTTTITVGEYDKKRQIQVSCASTPTCQGVYLHKFRKSCASRWDDAGVPMRTIQSLLGHKSLETTQIYLGVASAEKVRDRINAAAASGD